MTWNVIGVPVDCLGASSATADLFGTELSPRALRELGVIERVAGRDCGDLEARVVGSERDPKTGLVGGTTVHDTVASVRSAVRESLGDDVRALVLGGCCIPLMGALAGARDARGDDVGLVYIDGHLDLYDHETSPTGEAADMPTAAVLGIGEPGLLAVMDAPVVAPERLAVVGARDPDEGPHVGHLVDEMGLTVLGPDVISADAESAARSSAQVAASGGAFWIHLDVDVFDQDAFPATDYLMPGGLTIETGRRLAAVLGADDRVVGVSIGCYNPQKDPDSSNGRQLVELVGLLAGAEHGDPSGLERG